MTRLLIVDDSPITWAIVRRALSIDDDDSGLEFCVAEDVDAPYDQTILTERVA